MFFMLKKKKYISCLCFKNKANRGKQAIPSMITIREKLWHYHTVKKLPALLREITS